VNALVPGNTVAAKGQQDKQQQSGEQGIRTISVIDSPDGHPVIIIDMDGEGARRRKVYTHLWYHPQSGNRRRSAKSSVNRVSKCFMGMAEENYLTFKPEHYSV
jgi:hypothetical protein